MKQFIAVLILIFTCLRVVDAGGLVLYTTRGSSYVSAVQYETFSSPSAHLSYVTVKGGNRMQIQTAGIVAHIPFPDSSVTVASEDAEAAISQAEIYAARYPQYAKLLQSVGELWKRKLEAIKLAQAQPTPSASVSQNTGSKTSLEGATSEIPVVRTRSGQTLKNVRITRFEDDKAVITHDGGIGRLLISDIAGTSAFPEDVKAAIEKAQAAMVAVNKAEADRVAAEKRENERIANEKEQERLKKEEEETQLLAQQEQERPIALELHTRLAHLEQTDEERQSPISVQFAPEVAKGTDDNRPTQAGNETEAKGAQAEETKRNVDAELQARQDFEKQEIEDKAEAQKILEQESSKTTKALAKVAISFLSICIGIGLIIYAFLKYLRFRTRLMEGERKTLPSVKPQETIGNSRAIFARQQVLLVSLISIVPAGVFFLLFPIKWGPAVFWLVSPIPFTVGIILCHILSVTTRLHFTGPTWRKVRIGCFVTLYGLLGFSVGASTLIVLALGSKDPAFMRSGWNIIDMDEPILTSLAIQAQSTNVAIPASFNLSPPEHAVAKDIECFLLLKNKNWLLTRMKIQQVKSAVEFAQVLNDAAARFSFLRISSNFLGNHNITEPESIDKISILTRQMTEESSNKTAEEVDTYIDTFYNASYMYNSSSEVKKAMIALQLANNPRLIVDVEQATRHLRNYPLLSGSIEDVRKIFGVEGNVKQLEPTNTVQVFIWRNVPGTAFGLLTPDGTTFNLEVHTVSKLPFLISFRQLAGRLRYSVQMPINESDAFTLVQAVSGAYDRNNCKEIDRSSTARTFFLPGTGMYWRDWKLETNISWYWRGVTVFEQGRLALSVLPLIPDYLNGLGGAGFN